MREIRGGGQRVRDEAERATRRDKENERKIEGEGEGEGGGGQFVWRGRASRQDVH